MTFLFLNYQKALYSLKQAVSQIEEECETLSAQTQEASLLTATSTWVFESLSTCLPTRLVPDPQATIFQLVEYQLLCPLHVYVETEPVQASTCKDQEGTTANKRKIWDDFLPYCQTPVVGLGLGVDFTLPNNNTKNNKNKTPN